MNDPNATNLKASALPTIYGYRNEGAKISGINGIVIKNARPRRRALFVSSSYSGFLAKLAVIYQPMQTKRSVLIIGEALPIISINGFARNVATGELKIPTTKDPVSNTKRPVTKYVKNFIILLSILCYYFY
jgi:hypothetical protein